MSLLSNCITPQTFLCVFHFCHLYHNGMCEHIKDSLFLCHFHISIIAINSQINPQKDPQRILNNTSKPLNRKIFRMMTLLRVRSLPSSLITFMPTHSLPKVCPLLYSKNVKYTKAAKPSIISSISSEKEGKLNSNGINMHNNIAPIIKLSINTAIALSPSEAYFISFSSPYPS